jgi:hypothetical protein
MNALLSKRVVKITLVICMSYIGLAYETTDHVHIKRWKVNKRHVC